MQRLRCPQELGCTLPRFSFMGNRKAAPAQPDPPCEHAATALLASRFPGFAFTPSPAQVPRAGRAGLLRSGEGERVSCGPEADWGRKADMWRSGRGYATGWTPVIVASVSLAAEQLVGCDQRLWSSQLMNIRALDKHVHASKQRCWNLQCRDACCIFALTDAHGM